MARRGQQAENFIKALYQNGIWTRLKPGGCGFNSRRGYSKAGRVQAWRGQIRSGRTRQGSVQFNR